MNWDPSALGQHFTVLQNVISWGVIFPLLVLFFFVVCSTTESLTDVYICPLGRRDQKGALGWLEVAAIVAFVTLAILVSQIVLFGLTVSLGIECGKELVQSEFTRLRKAINH